MIRFLVNGVLILLLRRPVVVKTDGKERVRCPAGSGWGVFSGVARRD